MDGIGSAHERDSARPVILETRNLTKYFGKLVAFQGISVQIRQKEIASLIGPNGAGKTTFYNVITGKFPPSSGSILLRGEEIAGLPSYRIRKKGIARSFQITNIFNTLTVFENIRSAVIAQSMSTFNVFRHIDSCAAARDASFRILSLLGLEKKKDVPCSKLSYGDMRTVEIGMALVNEPDIIFLDEPTAGMSPEETKQTADLIKALNERTRSTFFITEHDMNVVFSISDRIVVLHYGQILADGTPAEIKDDVSVRDAYLGGLEDAEG